MSGDGSITKESDIIQSLASENPREANRAAGMIARAVDQGWIGPYSFDKDTEKWLPKRLRELAGEAENVRDAARCIEAIAALRRDNLRLVEAMVKAEDTATPNVTFNQTNVVINQQIERAKVDEMNRIASSSDA